MGSKKRPSLLPKSIDKTNIADVAKRTGDADHKALMNTCKQGEGKSPRKLSFY